MSLDTNIDDPATEPKQDVMIEMLRCQQQQIKLLTEIKDLLKAILS